MNFKLTGAPVSHDAGATFDVEDLIEAYQYPDSSLFFSKLLKAMESGFDFMAFLAQLPREKKAQHFDNTKVLMAVSYLCCGMQVQGDWFGQTDLVVLTSLFNHENLKHSDFFQHWNVGAIQLQEEQIRKAFVVGFQARSMQY